jgi:hypothetical protein
MKEAWTGELYFFKLVKRVKNPLNPFKQFGKEIRNGKQIGEDQAPDHYPFDVYFNLPDFFSLVDAKNFIPVHVIFSIVQRLGELHIFALSMDSEFNIEADFSPSLEMQKPQQ